MPSVADMIRQSLEERFHPLILSVADDSAKHAGHAGSRPEGETHFSVTVVSERFHGVRPLERHRMIYAALGERFDKGLHALSIRALTPQEAETES